MFTGSWMGWAEISEDEDQVLLCVPWVKAKVRTQDCLGHWIPLALASC